MENLLTGNVLGVRKWILIVLLTLFVVSLIEGGGNDGELFGQSIFAMAIGAALAAISFTVTLLRRLR